MRRAAWPLLAAAVLGGCVHDPDPTSGLSGSATGGGSASSVTVGADATGSDASDDASSQGEGSAASGSDGATVAEASDGATTGDDATTGSADGPGDATSSGDPTGVDDDIGASSSTGEPDELADGILDIVITAHDDCTFTVMPPMIAVPEGTAFTVNWISSPASDIELDIAKIDPFNAVPIILGMEPGTSYHDDIREWCGNLFTGTFDFELRSCFDPTYIPVDCSAP
jgi:hypothetical protein